MTVGADYYPPCVVLPEDRTEPCQTGMEYDPAETKIPDALFLFKERCTRAGRLIIEHGNEERIAQFDGCPLAYIRTLDPCSVEARELSAELRDLMITQTSEGEIEGRGGPLQLIKAMTPEVTEHANATT